MKLRMFMVLGAIGMSVVASTPSRLTPGSRVAASVHDETLCGMTVSVLTAMTS